MSQYLESRDHLIRRILESCPTVPPPNPFHFMVEGITAKREEMICLLPGKEWDQNLDLLILGVVFLLSHLPRKLVQAEWVDLWAGQESLMTTETEMQT